MKASLLLLLLLFDAARATAITKIITKMLNPNTIALILCWCIISVGNELATPPPPTRLADDGADAVVVPPRCDGEAQGVELPVATTTPVVVSVSTTIVT